MRKKLVSLLLIGAMAFSLAACGSSDSEATAENSSEAGSADEESEESTTHTIEGDAESTLTVWCWDASFNIEAMMEAGRMYKENVNSDFGLVVTETLSDDCEMLLTNAAESGQLDILPDIVLMQDDSFQMYVTMYPEAFTDLTDSGIDFSQFAEGKLSYSVVDGKNYGIPFDNGAVITCWRTDILDETGYTIEDLTDIDFDRFLEIARDIHEQTGMYILSGWNSEPYAISMMLQSAGGSLFDDDGNVDMVGNEILEECITYYLTMVEEGLFLETNSWTEYMNTITREDTVGIMQGNWITATIMSVDDTAGRWAITNMPSLVDAPNATNYSNSGGSTWYITSNCQNLDLAIDFMKNTFAGSVEFYDNILPTTGAISSYLPAGESDAYAEPQEYWNNQAIYKTIVEYSEQVPTVNTSPYYSSAIVNLGTQVQNMLQGTDMESALEEAQKQTEFDMQ